MATKTSQRIFIWVIAVVMLVGTIGTFGALILANENASDQVSQQQDLLKQYEDYQKMLKEEMAKNAANSLPIEGYKASSFDASKVVELKTEDLKVGNGETAKADTALTLSYFGWTPDGKIFDSSLKKNGEPQPFSFTPSEGGAIEGWVQGVPGMKEGGVRKIIVPSDMAYGAQGQGIIAPDTPLIFIVKLDKVGA